MKQLSSIISTLIFLSLTAHAAPLTGTIKIDGSSTVYPISEAMAEEFQKVNPKVRVTVGISGTGGGFKRFAVGETDISNASRPIAENERGIAKKYNVEYIELPIGYDGISVVVNPKNKFVDHLTVAELKKLWQPGSAVKMWSDIRPTWPKEKITLYGPGTDSGTFDYFTEEIVGKAKSSRSDFSPSEDDNVLVQGISGDIYSLGYFGFAYYEENQDKLRLVPIQTEKGKPVMPSMQSISDGTYQPLARPVFIYVNKKAAETRPEVQAFVKFYLSNAESLVKQVGYVPFAKPLYAAAMDRFNNKMTGTIFGTIAPEKRANIAELLKAKGQ